VNIWVLDPEAYALAINLVPGSDRAYQDTLADVIANDSLLDTMIERFDDITARMTRDFGAFEGHVVETHFTNMRRVGDINEDGRVNVLLYNLQRTLAPPGGAGGTTSGAFTNRDFANRAQPIHSQSVDLVPIPMFHMNIARSFGYRMATSNRPAEWMDFYETFAHELQHLLFFLHFGVYIPNSHTENHYYRYSWLDESLSELAGKFWTQDGTEAAWNRFTGGSARITNTLSNSYFHPPRYGDFVHFNGSRKSYGMGRLHSTMMHRHTAGAYATAIYNHFGTVFPPTTTPDEFRNRMEQVRQHGMRRVVGDALIAAGLTGNTGITCGETAFDLLYFIFMESFAADGGDIVTENAVHATTPFFPETNYSARNFWGIRPNFGTDNFVISETHYIIIMNDLQPLPIIAPGSNVSMSGSASLSIAATREMMFRLTGESTANPVLSISINDNDPRTQFYVVIPNDAPGAVSTPFFPISHLGADGATVRPLAGGNVVNVIDTGGQTAYLFVATLFRNVGARVDYTWGDGGGATPTPTPLPSPTPSPSPSPTPLATPTPTPVSGVVVNSWAELREAIDTSPIGETTILVGSSFPAQSWPQTSIIDIPANRHITLVSSEVADGAENIRVLTQQRDRRHFIVTEGSSLTLCQNITLVGGITSGGAAGTGGVQVNGGGELIMNPGSVIERVYRIAAIQLEGSGTEEATRARLTMAGGTIRHSSGDNVGGVSIGTNAIFVMGDGSTLYGNSTRNPSIQPNARAMVGGVLLLTDTSTFEMRGTATIRNHNLPLAMGQLLPQDPGHAGGVLMLGGTFTMYGGYIINNNSSSPRGGGGVRVSDGTFTMHGGHITGNTSPGGAVRLDRTDGTTFIMHDGVISNNTAGSGVQVAFGTMTMYGGEIKENTSTGRNSAGVHTSGAFTMVGGRIHNNTQAGGNTANAGGGVHVAGGVFSMIHNDAIIENNHTTGNNNVSGGGGGIFQSSTGVINITAGIITGNSTRTNGGGVSIARGVTGTFIMSGGYITHNEASMGGGVALLGGLESTFTMTGGYIMYNHAHAGGGGVSLAGASEEGAFTMTGGAISNNVSATDGGDIFTTQ